MDDGYSMKSFWVGTLLVVAFSAIFLTLGVSMDDDKADAGVLGDMVAMCVEHQTEPERIIACFEGVYGGVNRGFQMNTEDLSAAAMMCMSLVPDAHVECINAVY
jgi:hypothetical protein